jgi:hypothetical protein
MLRVVIQGEIVVTSEEFETRLALILRDIAFGTTADLTDRAVSPIGMVSAWCTPTCATTNAARSKGS